MNRVRRQQLIVVWCSIAVTWLACAVLEVVLFAERALVPVAVTTMIAAIAGVLLTRKVLAPHRRATITVEDLRVRRLQRR